MSDSWYSSSHCHLPLTRQCVHWQVSHFSCEVKAKLRLPGSRCFHHTEGQYIITTIGCGLWHFGHKYICWCIKTQWAHTSTTTVASIKRKASFLNNHSQRTFALLICVCMYVYTQPGYLLELVLKCISSICVKCWPQVTSGPPCAAGGNSTWAEAVKKTLLSEIGYHGSGRCSQQSLTLMANNCSDKPLRLLNGPGICASIHLCKLTPVNSSQLTFKIDWLVKTNLLPIRHIKKIQYTNLFHSIYFQKLSHTSTHESDYLQG